MNILENFQAYLEVKSFGLSKCVEHGIKLAILNNKLNIYFF